MSIDWNDLQGFLHSLGVELEAQGASSREEDGHAAHESHDEPEEPLATVLQRAHDHDAFYRIDWMETRLEMLVLLPTDVPPLKFHFYRVLLAETHPLAEVLRRQSDYEGSDGFEETRAIPELALFAAVVESMKKLFWIGYEASDYPPEIHVQQLC